MELELEWEVRVGLEGLEGLEGSKLPKHPKLPKLILSFLELRARTNHAAVAVAFAIPLHLHLFPSPKLVLATLPHPVHRSLGEGGWQHSTRISRNRFSLSFLHNKAASSAGELWYNIH
jgi:hypothetical protein